MASFSIVVVVAVAALAAQQCQAMMGFPHLGGQGGVYGYGLQQQVSNVYIYIYCFICVYPSRMYNLSAFSHNLMKEA